MAAFSDLWNAFWIWAEQHPNGAYYFRGQAGGYDIIPKIGRPAYSHIQLAEERALFEAFLRAARMLAPAGIQSDWEWMALAQHHGYPTRFTDWSTSPLVAAWFAVTSEPLGEDAWIYALDLSRTDIDILTFDGREARSAKTKSSWSSPFDVASDVCFLETAAVSPRITNQRGLFTLHRQPKKPLVMPDTEKFLISKDLRTEFQKRLFDIGIDDSHIYPGLEGLCKALDWRAKAGILPKTVA